MNSFLINLCSRSVMQRGADAEQEAGKFGSMDQR